MSNQKKPHALGTRAIHAGQEPEPATGAIVTPIFQTSTFVQQGVGDHKGYEYARTGNPTRRALELNLAALEKGEDAYCFASGMAATHAVFTLLKAGDSVLVSDNLYGGSHRLFNTMDAVACAVGQALVCSDRGCVLDYFVDVTRAIAAMTEKELLAAIKRDGPCLAAVVNGQIILRGDDCPDWVNVQEVHQRVIGRIAVIEERLKIPTGKRKRGLATLARR